MSKSSIETYKFKTFEFKVLKKYEYPWPICRFPAGHKMVSNDACLFSYGLYNCQESDDDGHQELSEMNELWKYCFDSGKWKKITYQCTPSVLAINKLELSNNKMIIHCTRNDSFGAFSIQLGNLADENNENGIQFQEFTLSGDIPKALGGQHIVIDNTYIYSIGTTYESLDNISNNEVKRMKVHRLDLNTKRWELLHIQEPQNNSQLDVLFYKGIIYLIAGGTIDGVCTFSKINMFHVTTRQWQCLKTKPDHRVLGNGYPNMRVGYSCAQCPEKSNLVYICGGVWGHHYNDVWRFDLDKLQWENFIWCTIPQKLSYHSATVTPSGRMCLYGGIVCNEDNFGRRRYRSNDIISVWVTIPKLKVICWEAMMHYFKDQMFQSSESQLKTIGIPPEFYKRIIQARNPVQ